MYVLAASSLISFWIVQMGIKVDANPGTTTETSVVPDKLGVFDIRCAELCGLLHADMETTGPTPTLAAPLLHYTFPSFTAYLEKLHRYALWGAADLYRAGRRAGPLSVALRPAWRFVRTYVVQAGFLDGTRGLVLCALQAYGTFLKWARLWEWRRFERLGWRVELPSDPASASARPADPRPRATPGPVSP